MTDRVRVETVLVNAQIFGQTRDAEVELIVDGNVLREGSDCVSRFWLLGHDRPYYLGHMFDREERAAFVEKARAAFTPKR